MAWLHPRSRYSDVIDQIHALGELRAGWNSYRAPAVEPAAMMRAAEFVESFPGLWYVPPPAVAPTPNGGVALRWMTPQYETEIIFLARGGEYMVAERKGEDVVMAGELGEVDPLKEIVQKYAL